MNKKPGILYVANYDSDVGYAWWLMESFWAALANHYEKNHNSFIAYPSISSIPQAISQAPIKCEEIDFTVHGFGLLKKQIKFLKEHNIQTIYFSDQPGFNPVYIFYRLSGVKYIITHDHTPGLRTQPGTLKLMLKQFKARIPFVNIDAYIGATEFVKQRAIQVMGVPKRKCFAAQNGLPELSEELAPLNLQRTFGIGPEKVVMVGVGRAHPIKGVPFILECMSKIVRKGIENLHFLYVGDGPFLNDFKQQAAQLGINDYVTFAGRRSDVGNILAASHFAIQASQAEVGYSLSILEYMQQGLATIVSDNASVCEVTDDNVTGLIYKEGQLGSAVNAILDLLNSQEKQKSYGEAAKIKVNSLYSLKHTHKALIAALEATLK